MSNKKPKPTSSEQNLTNHENLGSFLSNEDCQNIFKKYLTTYKHKKFYYAFFTNLFYVSGGLKCGYLIDRISVEQKIIVNIINDLISAKLIVDQLKVIIIHGDIVIINVEKFLVHLKKKQIFIDTSSHLKNPVLLAQDHSEIRKIKSVLCEMFNKYSSEDVESKINIHEDLEPLTINTEALCVPTIVGLLLNFPIVYWYKGDYKLTCVQLSVFKIMITSKGSTSSACTTQNKEPSNARPFELYSFSSPLVFQHGTFVRSFVDALRRSKIYIGVDLCIELIQTEERITNIVL